MLDMNWNATLERLKNDKGNWAAVAVATGLSRMQVSRIASGETPNPKIDTAQKITDYYDANPAPTEPARSAA